MMNDKQEAKLNMMLRYNKTNQEINRLADIYLKHGFIYTSDELKRQIGHLVLRNKVLKNKIDTLYGDVVL